MNKNTTYKELYDLHWSPKDSFPDDVSAETIQRLESTGVDIDTFGKQVNEIMMKHHSQEGREEFKDIFTLRDVRMMLALSLEREGEVIEYSDKDIEKIIFFFKAYPLSSDLDKASIITHLEKIVELRNRKSVNDDLRALEEKTKYVTQNYPLKRARWITAMIVDLADYINPFFLKGRSSGLGSGQGHHGDPKFAKDTEKTIMELINSRFHLPEKFTLEQIQARLRANPKECKPLKS